MVRQGGEVQRGACLFTTCPSRKGCNLHDVCMCRFYILIIPIISNIIIVWCNISNYYTYCVLLIGWERPRTDDESAPYFPLIFTSYICPQGWYTTLYYIICTQHTHYAQIHIHTYLYSIITCCMQVFRGRNDKFLMIITRRRREAWSSIMVIVLLQHVLQ